MELFSFLPWLWPNLALRDHGEVVGSVAFGLKCWTWVEIWRTRICIHIMWQLVDHYLSALYLSVTAVAFVRWVSAHYKAASSLLSQWLLNRVVRHVDKILWGDSIDLIAFNIRRNKLEWCRWGLILTFNTKRLSCLVLNKVIQLQSIFSVVDPIVSSKVYGCEQPGWEAVDEFKWAVHWD